MIREELILQYINNQLSGEDKAIVMEWVANNPLDFELMKEIWDESDHVQDFKTFDVDAEWDSFMGSMESAEETVDNIHQLKSSSTESVTEKVIEAEEKTADKVRSISSWKEWRPVAIAASFLFVVLSLYILWPRDYEVVHLATAESSEITLPDNTLVQVQPGSTVKYPNSFKNKEQRVVKLDGIATFDITPDPNKPFIVETSLAGIRALGTIFEVDASTKEVTGVQNIEGLVRMADIADPDKFVDIKEGESFSYDGKAFLETTPLPEPVIKVFKAQPQPKKAKTTHTVREIVNYLHRISNGHTVPKGADFDWNKRIEISLNTTNVPRLIERIQNRAFMNVVKKDCDDCYEILRFRVR